MRRDINENLLTLLAIAVFADKKVFSAEIETFVSVALRLLNVGSNNTEEFEKAILGWFDHNRPSVQSKLTAASFEKWYIKLVDSLIDVPNKNEILDCLLEISRADQDEHVSEKALVVLTAKRWNMMLPN